jgi:hypothetical protein
MPHDEVSNSAVDAAGQIVQAGTVTGGVHFHQPPPVRPATATLPLRVGLVPQLAASFQERATSDLLTRTLDGGDTAILVPDGARATVLSGMGGVGKTQLAADYAQRRWSAGELQLLVWVTAGSREAIVSSYANAATALTGREHLTPEQGARALLEWLAQATVPWLVVLDDLQAPADISGLWPPTTDRGRTVVTTRRRDAALRGHRRQMVEVGVFSEAEALACLRTALADQPSLLDGAEDLVRDLGCLPLALTQAVAYLLDKQLSCAQYRSRLAERRLTNVLPEPDELPDEHRATVAATWSLSVERADRMAPQGVAKPLLDIASVLAPNGIPAEVFTSGSVLAHVSAVIGRDVDESDARDGLGCLRRLSLITFDATSAPREVQVHALVQRATRDAWPDGHSATVVRTAADAVSQLWLERDHEPELEQVLRANVNALIDTGQDDLWRGGGHEVMFQLGSSLGTSGLVTEARAHFETCLEQAGRHLGPDHLQTLPVRHNLAFWQREAGDPVGATAAFEELLTEVRRQFGHDDPRTLSVRSNLAASRGRSGDAAGEAAEIEALLTDVHRVFGPDHPDTLNARNLLAHHLIDVGRSVEAVALLDSLLDDRVRVLGPDHPDTLITRGNLAYARGGAGDPVGAVKAFEELVADHVRLLGPGHPDTVTSRNNLAIWRGNAGDPVGATADFERLLDDCLRTFGNGHPRIGSIRANLAHWREQAASQSG